MACDVSKYLRHLEEFDLSDDQKRELIQDIWNVMEGFVDAAFGLDSTQIALEFQAKARANASHNLLKSGPEVTTVFNHEHAEADARGKE